MAAKTWVRLQQRSCVPQSRTNSIEFPPPKQHFFFFFSFNWIPICFFLFSICCYGILLMLQKHLIFFFFLLVLPEMDLYLLYKYCLHSWKKSYCQWSLIYMYTPFVKNKLNCRWDLQCGKPNILLWIKCYLNILFGWLYIIFFFRQC